MSGGQLQLRNGVFFRRWSKRHRQLHAVILMKHRGQQQAVGGQQGPLRGAKE